MSDVQRIRERNKADIRSLILETARKSFVETGYEDFSLRRLAQQIGYSPAAIYRHFRSKDDIFACLTAESFDLLIMASSAVVPEPDEDPASVLKRGMHAYVAFGIENPDHYRIAFLLGGREAKDPQRPRAAYEALRARIQRCIDGGRIPRADPDLLAQSLWAAAHGITSLLVQRPSFPWVARRKLVDRVIDSAVDALLVHPQAVSPGGENGNGSISKSSAGRKPTRVAGRA
jgi:AcrR family transcriptional regulator